MVTVSHIVENKIKKKPFLEEALVKGLINYSALAEEMKKDIEKELGNNVKTSAVMMALRRAQEKLSRSFVRKSELSLKETDISAKSDLFEITVLKSDSIIKNIIRLYDIIDFSHGDFLTITHGINEITMISNKKYKNEIEKILEDERIIKLIGSLASLTIKIPIEAINSEGLFYTITKSLSWENICITEIVSTLTELTFILKEDDIPRAFSVMKKLMEN